MVNIKFRIIKYYDRFRAQKLGDDGEWYTIGNPPGYATPEAAKNACIAYKKEMDDWIVEEFEL